MKTLIALLLTLSTSIAIAQQKPTKAKETSNVQTEGPIAGGGGYICTNSKIVLQNASKQLTEQLSKSADVLFSELPTGWTRQRMIQLVESVRLDDEHSDHPRRRDKKRLRFDYGRDAKGEYIIALEPFCYTYEATPVDFEDEEQLNKTYRQIQLEMLHEIAHLMNIGTTEATDVQARAFAKYTLIRLTNHFLLCEFPEISEQEKRSVMPSVPTSSITTKFIIANLIGKKIENYTNVLLQNWTNSEGWIQEPIIKGYQPLFRFNAPDDSFDQNLDPDGYMIIKLADESRGSAPFRAEMYIRNLDTLKEIIRLGTCQVLAKPLKTKFNLYK